MEESGLVTEEMRRLGIRKIRIEDKRIGEERWWFWRGYCTHFLYCGWGIE